MTFSSNPLVDGCSLIVGILIEHPKLSSEARSWLFRIHKRLALRFREERA